MNLVPGRVENGFAPIRAGSSGSNNDKIKVYNAFGSTDFIVDVLGWWVAPTSTTSNDGRAFFGAAASLGSWYMNSGSVYSADAANAALAWGPSYGVSAAIVNVTTFSSSGAGHLWLSESSSTIEEGSNVNYASGVTTTVGAVVSTAPDGTFYIHNCQCGSRTWVKIEVTGWIHD